MVPRLLAILLAVLVAAGAAFALLRATGEDPAPPAAGVLTTPPAALVPAQTPEPGTEQVDPLAYVPSERKAFERRAAAGLSHVLFARSPGGAIATARRVARWRPLIEEVAGDGEVVDPDVLEGIVFLESAGRPDAMAGGTDGAVGLTQILAETGRTLLGMRVDEAASARLTRGIRRGRAVARREARRRQVDERYDPRKALEGAVRYLRFAKGELGRDDLAVVSYHMGVGNLQNALRAFGEGDTRCRSRGREGRSPCSVPYARLFFDSTPARHAAAYRVLASLGDDSSTYLWRVRAAQRIMRLHREDPEELARLAALHARKNSAEEVLHPQGETAELATPEQALQALEDGELLPLDARRLRAAHGLRLDPRMGELVPAGSRALYRALRPEALAVLQVIGTGTRELSGTSPLTVTSTARDRTYQRRIIRSGNPEATQSYSLHTTGFSFDIARRYRSRQQALAFQFFLDRLQALDLIAWVREPGAIHVTVGPRARELVTG